MHGGKSGPNFVRTVEFPSGDKHCGARQGRFECCGAGFGSWFSLWVELAPLGCLHPFADIKEIGWGGAINNRIANKLFKSSVVSTLLVVD